jgi:hypothetical protein
MYSAAQTKGEQMVTYKIADIDREYFCELDPYRQDTNGLCGGRVLLDLSDHTVDVDTYSPGQGTSSRIWHGEVCTIGLPDCADGDDVTATLRRDDVQALIARVFEGSDVERDNSYNWVGSLTADAESALDELSSILSNVDTVDCWLAGDWLAQTSDKELGITADTTDEEIEAIAADLEIAAKSDSIFLLDSTDRDLTWRRDRLVKSRVYEDSNDD